jgi:hypothetical protein
MQISEALIAATVAGAAAVLGSAALAFDGSRSPPDQLSAVEAFRSGAQALKQGEKAKALSSLQYAAENGHPLAQWKLGQMYAKGDGVPRDDVRAFEYYSRIANSHAEDRSDAPNARIVSSALVALGHYYLDGIPNSPIRRDPERAWEMFHYAATYFADPNAQYDLARLYLEGNGAARNPRQAVRWLSLAANKGQYQAQALLGRMLFRGEGVPRQRARGLMWLTLGRDAAAGPEDGWIVQAYEDAFARATEAERSAAYADLQQWLKTQR